MADINFNPFDAPIFKGQGTPWGAPTNAGPNYGAFNQDPNAYAGFDSSKLRQALNQRMAQRGGNAQAQAQAALSKSGIKGADTTRAISDLTAQQELGANEMDANLALQDYQTRLQQMKVAQDQFNMQQGWEAQKAQAEDAGRSALWGNLMNTAGSVGGAMLGGYMGNKTPKAGVPGVGLNTSNADWWKARTTQPGYR